MLKGPEIKVIGKAPAAKKEETRKNIEKYFYNNTDSLGSKVRKEYMKLEYPKSPEEVAGINFANEETNFLMQDLGFEAYNIPLDNYHIVPPDIYKEMPQNKGNACMFCTFQAIFFNAIYARNNPLYFSLLAFHETLHLKGKLVMQAETKGKKLIETPYRSGVSVMALQQQKYHEHNMGLHEAIISWAEKKAFAKLLDRPEFIQEKEWRNSTEGIELRKKVSQEKDIPDEELVWVDHEAGKRYEILSYPMLRKVLEYVCQEIQKEFSEKFETIDSVYKKFLKAHFTGHLLEIGHLVEKTFGEGSFRDLSNMTQESKSAVLCLETLQKNRMRQLRKNK